VKVLCSDETQDPGLTETFEERVAQLPAVVEVKVGLGTIQEGFFFGFFCIVLARFLLWESGATIFSNATFRDRELKKPVLTAARAKRGTLHLRHLELHVARGPAELAIRLNN